MLSLKTKGLTMLTPSDAFELEDIAYGLKHGFELRPNEKRIKAFRALTAQNPNPVFQEMLKIWESGHGVLPKQERIQALQIGLA